MATSSTPSWNDGSSIPITMAVLARGSATRGVINLTSKFGAYAQILVGRMGTTQLTDGVEIVIRRMLGGAARRGIAGFPTLRGSITAAVATTCAAAGNTANGTLATLTVASTSGFAAGDLISIQDDVATPVNTISEFARVAKVTDATHLLLDAPILFNHNNVAHLVRNKAEAWNIWLEGGCTHEIIIDYGNDAAGESLLVTAEIQDLAAIVTA